MTRYAKCLALVALVASGCNQPSPPVQPVSQVSAAPAPVKPIVDKPIEAAKPGGTPTVVALEAYYVLPAADESGKKLTVEEINRFLADASNHEPTIPQAPFGLDDASKHIPADNPITRAKVELGRLLYFEPRLSRDETVSCATCHHPTKGWTDQASVSTGINGQKGGRSAPTVMNRLFSKTQFWDGRAGSLEEQALGPIANPIEMGFTHAEAVERLKGIEGYRLFFDKVFGGVSADAIAKAIATFERTVLVGAAPHDYQEAAKAAIKLSAEDIADLPDEDRKTVEKLIADAKAHPLSDAARRGRDLYFGKAECSLCHVGYNLTDELFYNIGVGMDQPKPDPARQAISKDTKDAGAYKTPSLRNIKFTAPYMHDGSQKTLLEVVKWYNKGGYVNPNLHSRVKKLNLTDAEMADLVVFLNEGLTGPMVKVVAPRLP